MPSSKDNQNNINPVDSTDSESQAKPYQPKSQKPKLGDLKHRFASVQTTDETDPKLKVITAKPRQEDGGREWHDPTMFSGYFRSSNRDAASSTSAPDEDRSSKDRSLSRAGRRLSLVTPEVQKRASITRDSLSIPPRRDSLTPLAYFAQHEAVEQYIEPAAVINPDAQDSDSPEQTLPILAPRDSAEHFRLPRSSVAGGIKIEITPPSALKEANNVILETVVMEVPIDESAPVPSLENSRIFVVQQLTKSTADVPEIAITSSSETAETASSGPTVPRQSVQEISSSHTNSVPDMPAPPARRRTKLIAVNVRRQTLSAVPRISKTVRFAPSPIRETAVTVAPDTEMEDRSPHLWSDEKAQTFGGPEELAMEQDEPLVPGLLRSSDLSNKELNTFQGKINNKLFQDERDALHHFLDSRFPESSRKALVARS
ncbi:uncharacterized protein LOC129590422 isoform X2 [Paramacrobiotus metropolitanus]|uniref:uncharacterized protein LOC129590422 isoform X2 n=1 Tax=Paramacrobiotus metropolitanus TaxID=2943436 RepID=UPI0024461233|nr:uncharacterized protein LOC129590422 isoform X2 [Paramacrobiotus metropolitanus]